MELPHPPWRCDGFFFDPQVFRLDLYRLLCAFFASADFDRLRERAAGAPKWALDIVGLGELGGEFEEAEITHLLVSIAARVRMVQDRERARFEKLRTNCGDLIPDVKQPRKKVPLTLREACNKIIHANRFNFDAKRRPRRGGDPDASQALNPIMHLYGTQGRTNWKAKLHVEAFVACNVALVQG
jgi:hypothetical protein